MTGDMRQLERELERQIDGLGRLLDAAPSSASVERLKSALDEETSRIGRRQSLMSYVRVCMGAAAAVLLALGLTLPRAPQLQSSPFALDDNPEQAFTEWVDALDESGAQLTSLLDDGWFLDCYGDSDDASEVEGDPLNNLEESLESLERVIGV